MTTSASAVAGSRRAWILAALAILVAAFAIRAGHFGNPVMHVDEDFYLLVGDRMLHRGALPYVDLWDRKPIGIFLVYEAIRLLGGVGILQYQIVATLFAAATAFVIARIAGRYTTPFAGAAAGICYVIWLGLFGGEGGQTPVFYNLLTALAALVTLRALLEGPADPARHRRAGVIAMALVGVAMQIKYNVMFEGIFFALALLWAGWRADPRPLPRLADALLLAAVALLPTALAFAYYIAIGQTDAFFYANFVSILQRPAVSAGELLTRLGKIMIPMSGLLVIFVPAVWNGPWRRGGRGAAVQSVVLAWVAAAVAGFLIFGTYYNHYALPLLLPITAAMAPTFAIRRGRVPIGILLATAMIVCGTIAYKVRAKNRLRKAGDAAYIQAVADVVRANLHGGCLYVHDGETILYHLTGSCIPTRWLFPNHLNTAVEASAIGTNPAAEVARTFERKPTVVVSSLDRTWDVNYASRAVADRYLRRDYRLVYATPIDEERRAVYVRLPGR